MTPGRPRLTSVVLRLTGADVSSIRTWWTGAEHDEPDGAGAPANRRLTALTGVLVLPLAAAALLTGLFFDELWGAHFFIGYLLLPVALVKISSTTYRMARYYLRSGLYRAIRAPYPLGRVTSPVLVIAVVVLFISGMVMWFTHSQRDPWGFLHTDAAMVFCGIVLLHLGLYLPEAFRAAQDDFRRVRPAASARRTSRMAVVGAALLAGLLLGVITIGQSQQPARDHRDQHGGRVEGRVP